jgi:protein N-terminal amidase
MYTNFHSPYKFEAPWSAWEFAYHILHKEANLVILSMAWLTREDARSYSRSPKDPDMETLSYWLARLEPVIRAETEGEIIVVIANRSGTEEEAVYAGTSTVLGLQGGEVKVYGILGRGEKELLVVDTKRRPEAKLISQPVSAASNISHPPSTTKGSLSTRSSRESQASGLSVDTSATSPDVGNFPQSMAEIMTPLTPADATSPNAFFTAKGKTRELDTPYSELKSSIPDNAPETPFENVTPFDNLKSNVHDAELKNLIDDLRSKLHVEAPPTPKPQLKSSIPEPTFTPLPNSPTFKRPPSPKSRNASRTRMLEEPQQPALISHDLATAEQTILRSTLQSPPLGIDRTPPKLPLSGGAIPDRYQSSFTNNTFGARDQHLTPRPRSAIW